MWCIYRYAYDIIPIAESLKVCGLFFAQAEAPACYVSFPGKYAAGWDALIKEQHDLSVACVFLCTPEDGLGQHSSSPDGRCYCHQIYGEREYKTFGYPG